MTGAGIPAAAKGISGLMTEPELALLCRMARSARSLVELGTYKGRSLAAMMLTNPHARAWAVDWFGDMSHRGYAGATEQELRANLDTLHLKPAGIIAARTDEAAEQFNETVELLHIDAGHSYEECAADLNNWIPKVAAGGAACIHDYGKARSAKLDRPEVQRAVDDWRNPAWVEVERAGTMIAFRNIVAERGALYVAYGEAARKQAEQSISTLKHVAPRLPVAAVAETPVLGADIHIYHGELDRGAREQKTRMYSLSPFRLTLFVDADTRVLSSPEAGFMLLAHADVVLAQDPVRIFGKTTWPYLVADEVAATKAQCANGEVCYYNSGVVFFRRNERVQRMMQAWNEEWQRWHRQDQPALLRAIYQHPVRIATMRPPWNTHKADQARFVYHMHRTANREGAPK